ncbi:transporter substrate-binding domain-containing protein [Marinomonas epiphytica]
MKRLLTTCLLIGTAFSTQLHAQKIRIAIDGSYAPFAEVNAQGELFGFDVDIANALCLEMKADCKIISQAWDGMIPGLQVGKFDAVISSMSVTKERSKVVDFSDHYYSNVLAFIGPKDQAFDFKANQLTGLVLGAYRSTVSSQYLEEHYAEQSQLKLYDTQEQAYLDLKAGRINLLLSDKFPAYHWLSSTLDNQDFEFKGEDIDINDKVAVAVKKGSSLKQKFNQAIHNIVNNGTYQKINRKYFPFNIY